MISVVVNCDTRPVHPEIEGMFKGVRSRDFLVDGIKNKIKFFEGHEIEVIAFVDVHEPLTVEQFNEMSELCSAIVVRKHDRRYRGNDPFGPFNDINYLQALFMARGDIIAHFDQDIAAFSNSPDVVHCLLQHLDSYNFVCGPSVNHPHPCHAPEYEGKFWASTRFFMCKRETLKFDVLERAIREPQWFYDTYDRPPRESPWMEQFLGILGEYKVLYPKPEMDRYAIFPWMRYRDGLLAQLNGLPYPEVQRLIERAGGAGTFYDGADASYFGL